MPAVAGLEVLAQQLINLLFPQTQEQHLEQVFLLRLLSVLEWPILGSLDTLAVELQQLRVKFQQSISSLSLLTQEQHSEQVFLPLGHSLLALLMRWSDV